MDEQKSIKVIDHLQKKWSRSLLLAYLLIAACLSFIISIIAIRLLQAGWVIVPYASVVVFAIVFLFFYKRPVAKDVTSFLDHAYPDLQESTWLLLKNPDELNFLEQLQVKKIEEALPVSINSPAGITRIFRIALSLLLVALVLFFALRLLSPADKQPAQQVTRVMERKPALVKDASISIAPPAYTGKRTRSQNQFNLNAEEGAEVSWHVTTSSATASLKIIFNDGSILPLKAADSTHTRWLAKKQILSSGFYQVQVADTKSELYRIEMIKDAFPSVIVRSPKPNSLIEPGQPQRTDLEVLLSDDYAVRNAAISATIASGNGEAVKFKKQQMIFTDFVAGNRSYQLKKTISLASLGMQPGDELYFYITATDSHSQEKRSDIYIVRIEDTQQLLSMDGIMNGLDLKPEFFRSQRQIIIETEQLLKGKDTMSAENFKQKSNSLGIDQQLLRLRYGKFLGEETNAEIGKNDHDHEAGGHNGAVETGNAQQMIDEVAHKHDNAEDAGFFDPQTKKQLKATLDEMWKAELQLRIIKPSDALPFEYKALKLLKDLQQQSRVYVAKTGSKTPPLKTEKRLTGELDKILQPVQQKNIQSIDEATAARKALGILEQLKNKETLSPASLSMLEQAGLQLGNKAAEEPGTYLDAFEAYKRILINKYGSRDIFLSGAALQKMIRTAPRSPSQGAGSGDTKLSHQYFMNLNRANE